MTRHRRLLGEGARCSVLLSKLRPSIQIEAAFPNRLPMQHLEDLVAMRHEQITRRGLMYEAVFSQLNPSPALNYLPRVDLSLSKNKDQKRGCGIRHLQAILKPLELLLLRG